MTFIHGSCSAKPPLLHFAFIKVRRSKLKWKDFGMLYCVLKLTVCYVTLFLLFSVPTCHKEPNCELILPAGRVTDSSDPRVVSDDCTDTWVHLQNICYDGKQ